MNKDALIESISTLDKWAIAVLICLAVGAVGALIVGFLQWRANDQLQAIQTAENLAQQKEIFRLSAESNASRAAIAEANKQTELARKDASIAEQHALEAKLELAKFKAPRTLSIEQQKKIREEMSSFRSKQFDAATTNETESINLLEAIEQILSALDWKELPWPGDPTIVRNGKPPVGQAIGVDVSIQVDPTDSTGLLAAAKALASALNAQGIHAAAEYSAPNNPSKDSSVIHVIVGRKT